MQWLRKAAENGHHAACLYLAARVYGDHPYAREVGHVGEAPGVDSPAGIMSGHDVPPDVLNSVVHWLRKGGHDPTEELDDFRTEALDGGQHCRNDGCEVVGHLKDLQSLPAVQNRPVLWRCVSETRLDLGRAQGDVRHNRLDTTVWARSSGLR
jgi:hypothetical protein